MEEGSRIADSDVSNKNKRRKSRGKAADKTGQRVARPGQSPLHLKAQSISRGDPLLVSGHPDAVMPCTVTPTATNRPPDVVHAAEGIGLRCLLVKGPGPARQLAAFQSRGYLHHVRVRVFLAHPRHSSTSKSTDTIWSGSVPTGSSS